MAKIRVLIVDDSVVIRRLLSEELSKDPDIEAVERAATGKNCFSENRAIASGCGHDGH